MTALRPTYILYVVIMQSQAFDLEYLGRVVDVKDTVNKAPLMIHLVELVVEKFPDASDLYSELPSVHRVAKVRDTCMGELSSHKVSAVASCIELVVLNQRLHSKVLMIM